MCGRVFIRPTAKISHFLQSFGISAPLIETANNVCPTQQIPVLHQSPSGSSFSVTPMRWWLHPLWSKEEPNQKYAMFNAKIESILTTPAFRGPVKHHRGIVLIDGFVEWQTDQKTKKKQPYYIQGVDDPLAAAAVWEIWREEVLSCAIITQPASYAFQVIHHRMPLILSQADSHRWLDHTVDPGILLEEFKGSFPRFQARAISTAVNNARNKDPVAFID